MANLDLMSYERDSRWMPHLSWAYPDLTLQQRMEQQAAQREQAWQKIADKLGPLLIGSDIGGSYGQSDYISRDICEDQEYLERAYEKAPLLSSAKYPSSNIRSQKQHTMSNTRSISYNNNNLISQQDQRQRQQQQYQRVGGQQQQARHKGSQQQQQQQKHLSSQKQSNLNLYAQQHHHMQMPLRGQNQTKQNCSSHQSGGSKLFTLLSVLSLILLLLVFSLLLFFFYFKN